MASNTSVPAFLRRENADNAAVAPSRASQRSPQWSAGVEHSRLSSHRSSDTQGYSASTYRSAAGRRSESLERTGRSSRTQRIERDQRNQRDQLAHRAQRSNRSGRSIASDDFSDIGRVSSWGSSAALFTEDDIREELERDGELDIREGRRSSKSRDQRKRSRSKARADKMFDRQFGDAEASMNGGDAPRAAVYEGKMGSKHRRATRMQESASRTRSASSGLVGSIGEGISSTISSASITSRTLKVCTAVICVVLMCAFLYTPAQQYYHAQREHARLEVEYATIQNRNDALDVQNDILASEAGMEDSVRQKFGYVKKGEETAIVTGLSENATDASRDSEGIEANVLSSSVKAPEEWYTPVLDALFGVE